jgi:hypothetical protein
MSDRFTEVLREKFDTDAWLRPEPLDTHVFAVQYKLFVVNGLRPHNQQVYNTPAEYQLPIEQAQKRPVPTTEWTFLDGGSLYVVAAYECESRPAARAHLLRLLGGFQGPAIERVPIAGEIAFVAPHGWTALMQRGNLVFFAHNGTEALKSVVPILQAIDESLVTERSYSDKLDVHVGVPEPGGQVPLRLPPLADDEWIHIVAHGGEMRSAGGGDLFFSLTEGKAVLNIARISPDGVAGVRIEIG